MRQLYLAIGLAACGTPTSSLQPHVSAIWNGVDGSDNAMIVNASFYTIDGSSVQDVPLDSGHSVTATYRGQTVTLDPSGLSGPESSAMLTYIPVDPTQPPDGQTITVALHGDGNDASTSLTMPDSFTIDPTSVPTSVSRAMPITVRWSPPSLDAMTVSMSLADTDNSSCGGFSVSGFSASGTADAIPVAGEFVLPANAITASGTCTLELDLSRARYGTAASDFHSGGEVAGWQTRSIVFVSTP